MKAIAAWRCHSGQRTDQPRLRMSWVALTTLLGFYWLIMGVLSPEQPSSRFLKMRIETMRASAILAITTAMFVSHAALADVKRHEFIPESLRGSWAPSTEVCKNADKSIIVVSAKTYTSSEANCTIVWVSETPAVRGPIYSAHLLCSKPDEKLSKTQSDVVFSPKDNNQISIGSRFSNLKIYQRCSASEPATKR
jgi:hypothetical protein